MGKRFLELKIKFKRFKIFLMIKKECFFCYYAKNEVVCVFLRLFCLLCYNLKN